MSRAKISQRTSKLNLVEPFQLVFLPGVAGVIASEISVRTVSLDYVLVPWFLFRM
jgi:hypothetical protein